VPKVQRKSHEVTKGGVRGDAPTNEKPTTNGFANQVNDAFQSDKPQELGLSSGAGVNGPTTNNTSRS